MKFTQSCPTLCDPMDYTVHGILQARILEWVALPFSRGSSQLQADSLPAEPQRKPKNTDGVCGKLSWHTEGRTINKLGRVRADSWEEEVLQAGKGNHTPDKGKSVITYMALHKRKDLSEECGGLQLEYWTYTEARKLAWHQLLKVFFFFGGWGWGGSRGC